MKTIKHIATALLIVPVLLLTNCDELEEEKTDFLEEATGTYTYTMDRILVSDPEVHDQITGTLEVASTEVDIFITMDPTGDYQGIRTQNVTMASNGFVFDITSYTDNDSDGDYFDVRGGTAAELDGEFYNGRYDSDSKQLTFKARLNYTLDEFDIYNFDMVIIAVKDELMLAN